MKRGDMTASKRIVTLSGAGFIAALLVGASCGGGSGASPDGGGGGGGQSGGSGGRGGQSGGGAGQSGATTGSQGCTQTAQVLCMREIACTPADAGAPITQADCLRLESIAL